jgi:peptide/nickel transport system permease protein
MKLPMAGYILSRLLQALPVLLGVSVAVFLAIRLIPGDPAIVMLGTRATPEALAQMRENLGLDRPLPEQYARFLAAVLSGRFGQSLVYRRPVLELILDRLPPTLWLTGYSATLTALISLPLATLVALRSASWIDYLLRGALMLTFAMPSFWLAIVLIQVVSVRLRWLPVSGWGEGVPEHLGYLLLPSLTIALALAPPVIHALRASILEHLRADHVRTARAKGLAEHSVVLSHVLRLALVPAVTLFGLQIGALLGGAVVIESIFAIPGVGQLLLAAILARDYPVVQGIVLLLTLAVIIINLATDLAAVALNPRAHVG